MMRVAACACLALSALGCRDETMERSYGGPLEDPSWRNAPEVSIALRPPKPAGTAAAGFAVVTNRGSEPAILERIAPFKPSRNVRVASTRTADHRRIAIQFDQNSWPPPPGDYAPGSLGPVRGRVVPPDDGSLKTEMGLQLLVLVDLPRPGRYTFRGVRVDYRVADRRYWVIVPVLYAICTPRKLRCPEPEP